MCHASEVCILLCDVAAGPNAASQEHALERVVLRERGAPVANLGQSAD